MSTASQPATTGVNDQSLEVIVISHSAFFYWWPVWVVGFIMAGISFVFGHTVAFVPAGTVAERGAQIAGHDGPRDVLIAPAGQPLPAEPGSDGVLQPSLRMVSSNNLGIIWATTLCLVIVFTQVNLRGLASVIVVIVLVFTIILFAVLGWWDPVLRTVQIIDVHVTAFGYLAISLLLFALWLLVFLVYDRQAYMIFQRGQVRVRLAIGAGESAFDTRGIVVEKLRDDLFRHWLLGFGAGDLTVRTSGSNPRYFNVPNVLGVRKKLDTITRTVRELQVVEAGM
jgi:hypothetical protein